MESSSSNSPSHLNNEINPTINANQEFPSRELIVKEVWLDKFMKALSHFYIFTGFTILSILIIGFIKNIFSTYNEYMLVIWIMLFLYSIAALFIGTIGMSFSQTNEKKQVFIFFIGVVFLSVFTVLIFIINFCRSFGDTLNENFSEVKYGWKLREKEVSSFKSKSIIESLKFNIIVLFILIFVNYLIITKALRFYKINRLSLLISQIN